MHQRLHAIFVRASAFSLHIAGMCLCASLLAADAFAASGRREPVGGSQRPNVPAESNGTLHADGRNSRNPLREGYEVLGKARRAFYEGKVEECLSVLEELEGDIPLQVKLEGKFLGARALWESGTDRDVKASRKLVEQLSREVSDWKAGPVRLAIARALQLEEEEKSPEAIRVLEAAVARGVKNTATAEAQVELARLLASAGRVEEAKKQLDSAEGMLKREVKIEMYQEEASAYLFAIEKARKNLKYDANPGLGEVEEADKLRKAGKFIEAGKLYQRVIESYPAAESADRASVGVGWCILGRRVQVISFAGSSSFCLTSARAEDVAAATQHWKAFVTARPAGRWRGQAYGALLSLGMDGRLPPEEAGKICQLAATSLPGALADEKSKGSWQACQFELRLKLGTLSWVHGRTGEAAEQIKQCALLAGGDRGASLQGVVECIQAGKGLLPDDIAAPNSGTVKPKVPTDRAGLVLSVALIQALAGERETAQGLIALVTDRTIGATQGQLAFGEFLRISLGEASSESGEVTKGKAGTVEERYERILRENPKLSFADEILYRLASGGDTTAAGATDDDPLKLRNSFTKPDAKAPDAKTNAEGVKAAEASKKSKSPIATDNRQQTTDGAAYYRELATKCLNSPRRERALWRLGRISLDAGQADAADQAFAAQLRDYPKGPYAGDAYVRLIDNALEYRFDMAGAKKAAEAAVAWAEINRKSENEDRQLLEPWRLLAKTPNLPVPEWVKYEVYLRAGFISYLDEDFALAKTLFEKGGPANIQPGKPVPAEVSGISLYLMLKACEKKWVPWDAKALEACRTEAQRVGIKLADCYIYGARSDRGLAIYQRILGKEPCFAPLTSDIEAYATWKLALAYAESRRDIPKAKELYGLFARPPFNKSPWVPDALLRLGVLITNSGEPPADSMHYYQTVFTQYPAHPLAEKAMYFYCIEAIRAKNVALARKGADEFLKRYAGTPNSSWRQDVAECLKKLESETSK